MNPVIFPLLVASLIMLGCSVKTNKSSPVAAPETVTWNNEEILSELVCGTTILIRHKKGLYLESGEELRKPDYSAKIITNDEGGYTTSYDYDEKNNTLSVTKSSRYYGVRPTVTVQCQ